MHYTTLHCTSLHYTALHCTALHWSTLQCTVQFGFVVPGLVIGALLALCDNTVHTTLQHTSHCIIIHFTLHYNTLHTALQYTSRFTTIQLKLHYDTIEAALQYISHCTTLHFTLHYNTVLYTELHYLALHCTVVCSLASCGSAWWSELLWESPASEPGSGPTLNMASVAVTSAAVNKPKYPLYSHSQRIKKNNSFLHVFTRFCPFLLV